MKNDNNSNNNIVNELKGILQSCDNPHELNNHKWVDCLFVKDIIHSHTDVQFKSPGYQLLFAISELFKELMPSTPPRQGKRIDTRWAHFGMLAAQYFSPFLLGNLKPVSLIDAWAMIDSSIFQFAYEKNENIDPEKYCLFTGEQEVTPVSTLSDWNNDSIKRLAEYILARERYLSISLNQPSPLLRENHSHKVVKSTLLRVKVPINKKIVVRSFLTILLLLILFITYKGIYIYQLASRINKQLVVYQQLANSSNISDNYDDIGKLLFTTRGEVELLEKSIKPFIWFTPLFKWVPEYGNDIAATKDVLNLAVGLTVVADETFKIGQPYVTLFHDNEEGLTFTEVLPMLAQENSNLMEIENALSQAIEARENIEIDGLSTRLKDFIIIVDKYIPLMQDGLIIFRNINRLLGGGVAGQQTYLLLIQNEDELRATGGFISAIGKIIIKEGKIVDFVIEDSYEIDDLNKPTFTPPWQMREYMNVGLWWIRDVNWSPNFPTSAENARQMYFYFRGEEVDGVISVDQKALQLILKILGPIKIDYEGESYTVDTENVFDIMRSLKDIQVLSGNSYKRKDFMRPLARELLNILQTNSNLPWADILNVTIQALDEKHLLIWLKDSELNKILAKQGWNGEMKMGEGDYLMTVDSNLGYNKVNAKINVDLDYIVDLSDLLKPSSVLLVKHKNLAEGPIKCIHWGSVGDNSYKDNIDRCYWNYLRVYILSGTQLISATPHEISGDMMILGEDVPAKVDDLTNTQVFPERIDGLRAFGTMLLVPQHSTLQTKFEFNLPSTVINREDDGSYSYSLRIQKQPGTDINEINLRIKLPKGAVFVSSIPEGKIVGTYWNISMILQKDINIKIIFQIN